VEKREKAEKELDMEQEAGRRPKSKELQKIKNLYHNHKFPLPAICLAGMRMDK